MFLSRVFFFSYFSGHFLTSKNQLNTIFFQKWAFAWCLNHFYELFMIFFLLKHQQIFCFLWFSCYLTFHQHNDNRTCARDERVFWTCFCGYSVCHVKSENSLSFFSADGDINDVMIKTLSEAHANTNTKLEDLQLSFRKPQVGWVLSSDTFLQRESHLPMDDCIHLKTSIMSGIACRIWTSCFTTRTCAKKIYGKIAQTSWQTSFRTSSNSRSLYPDLCD